VVVALDGETFGHHQRGAEKMLAQFIAHHRDELANFGRLYERGYRGEVEIVERTSWSCAHGLGRWSRDCGCDGPAPWREGLRRLVDWVGEAVDKAFEERLGPGGWRLLREYIYVLMGGDSSGYSTEQLKLLEAQRAKLAANTSDAWFFARVGIEFGIVVKWALRAVELLDDVQALEELMRRLGEFVVNGRTALAFCPRLRGPLMAAVMYVALSTAGQTPEKVGPYLVKPVNDEFEVVDTRTREAFRFRHDLLWSVESFK
jgi:hypothetical protein